MKALQSENIAPVLRPAALSIAGFDPSGGAGLLADVKTFEQMGVYGFGAVSALTYQNDSEFDKVEWVSIERIAEQVSVLLRRFDIRFVKIGLIENIATLHKLLDFLHSSLIQPTIVYDPILRASAGFDFRHHVGELASILPRIHCITPNVPEADAIFGGKELTATLEEKSQVVNIYLKGGHASAETVMDMLFTADHTYVFTHDRIPEGEKHGSGCVLSSALTAGLALGHSLPDAAERASEYTHKYLSTSPGLLGYHNAVVL